MEPGALASVATLLFALMMALIPVASSLIALCALLVAGGVAWIGLMSTFNVATQQAVPGRVRARGLAAYMLVSQGAMAIGSAVWGSIADRFGWEPALWAAALGLPVGLLFTRRYSLGRHDAASLKPSLHWPDPSVMVQPKAADGPVLVTVEYTIDPQHATDFLAVMRDIERLRRRDGADAWWLFCDAADHSMYVEGFIVGSWAEHLRQHERVTVADREVEERARRFHTDEGPPLIRHLISERVVQASPRIPIAHWTMRPTPAVREPRRPRTPHPALSGAVRQMRSGTPMRDRSQSQAGMQRSGQTAPGARGTAPR